MKTRKGYQVAEFKNRPVRILKGKGADSVWICLYDLCKILKRPLMMETQEARNLCPSSSRIIFKKGDKALLAIHPRDVSNLVCLLKKESKTMEELCVELEKWAESFFANGKELVIMDQKPPITFSYMDKFPITFKTGNGKTFVNATEMAKGFGKSPAIWLRWNSTSELRHALVNSGRSESYEGQVITSRGIHGATWIEDCLVLEFAKWLSDDFSEWCNSKIQELILQGYVVIRQPEMSPQDDIIPTGAMTNFPVPKTLAEALRLAAIQQEEIEQLKELAEENKPKIEFYEKFIENRDWFKSSTIADELQVTPRALHIFLRDEKICKYENRQWVVYGYHSSLQCDIPYYWRNKNGKTYAFGKVKRWTPAGREYILDLWRTQHSEEQNRE